MYSSLMVILISTLLAALLLTQPAAATDRQQGHRPDAPHVNCGSEMQVVMCGQIPFKMVQARAACCDLHKPLPPQVRAAAMAAAAAAPSGTWDWSKPLPLRADLQADGLLSQPLDYQSGSCTTQLAVQIPAFYTEHINTGQPSTTPDDALKERNQTEASPTPPPVQEPPVLPPAGNRGPSPASSVLRGAMATSGLGHISSTTAGVVAVHRDAGGSAAVHHHSSSRGASASVHHNPSQGAAQSTVGSSRSSRRLAAAAAVAEGGVSAATSPTADRPSATLPPDTDAPDTTLPPVSAKVEIRQQTIPALTSQQIQRIATSARAQLPAAVVQRYEELASVHPGSGFVHPATYAGPAELALMKYRLLVENTQGLQTMALEKLITGVGVLPKVYEGGWFPDINCPVEGYSGPFPMPKVAAKWGGTNNNAGTCAANYPTAAPQRNCAHVSFVELDAQMAYKQALAFHATGDVRHAETAQRIMLGWATENKEWGLQYENGPLEAGWGCAAMSRAMELIKHANWEGFSPDAYKKYVEWVQGTLMPQMDFYVEQISKPWAAQGAQNVFGNWHSTIADCYVAFGLLTDDTTRYQQGIDLYHLTVKDYLRWGRGEFANNRIIGEASETLRDIYHTLFGLGGLVQVAEQAWQQHADLYSSNDHALAAALELHARIINAGEDNNTGLLPPGFKLFKEMPKPPSGAAWKFDIRRQLWFAQDQKTGENVMNLVDGNKYLLGNGHLPTGWELGYNHYVGRMGLNMPETAKLIARNWPDYYTFHWGLATLTHADTAQLLWRPGVTQATLCADSSSSSSNSTSDGNATGP